MKAKTVVNRGSNKKRKVRSVVRDSKENVKLQKAITDRANYSLAILGMAFVWRGSGRFFNIRCTF